MLFSPLTLLLLLYVVVSPLLFSTGTEHKLHEQHIYCCPAKYAYDRLPLPYLKDHHTSSSNQFRYPMCSRRKFNILKTVYDQHPYDRRRQYLAEVTDVRRDAAAEHYKRKKPEHHRHGRHYRNEDRRSHIASSYSNLQPKRNQPKLQPSALLSSPPSPEKRKAGSRAAAHLPAL